MKYLVKENKLYTSFNKELVYIAGSVIDAKILAYLLNQEIIKENDFIDAMMSTKAEEMAGGE